MHTSIRWCPRTPRRWLTPPRGRGSWWTRDTALRCVHSRSILSFPHGFPLFVKSVKFVSLNRSTFFFFSFCYGYTCPGPSQTLILCTQKCLVSLDPVWLALCDVKRSKTHQHWNLRVILATAEVCFTGRKQRKSPKRNWSHNSIFHSQYSTWSFLDTFSVTNPPEQTEKESGVT